MTVYFANSGLIDLDVIRVMGVSVKENDSPIGFFGTGLKYAIATLLRTGHEIELHREDEVFVFTARETQIRGEPFSRVFMNDEPMPFTTSLGRTWEVWQAYRELHSNTLDELGEISAEEIKDDTVIKVTGDKIDKAFLQQGQIFLLSNPLDLCGSIEIHPGPSSYVYYRGVRAGALPEKSLFTYNVTGQMELSEDRCFKSLWDVEYEIEKSIPLTNDADIASTILSGCGAWDQCLTFSICGSPSQTFLQAAKQNVSNANMNQHARKMVEKSMQVDGSFPSCDISAHQRSVLQDALNIIEKLGAHMSLEDFVVTETLGPQVFGLYHISSDQIFISQPAIDMGTLFVAATLYEEWVHKTHKHKDCTRGMQDFLFQRLIALVDEAARTSIRLELVD